MSETPKLQADGQVQSDPSRTSESVQVRNGCASWLAVGLVWVWIGFVLLIRFIVEIVASGLNPSAAESGYISISLISGLAILIPCLLGMFVAKNITSARMAHAQSAHGGGRTPESTSTEPPPSSTFELIMKTWAWAAIFILLSMPARLGGSISLQKTNLLQIFCSLVFIGLLLYLNRWRKNKKTIGDGLTDDRGNQGPFADWRSGAALLIAGCVGYSWFAWGALGSPLDSVLALLNGVIFGAAAGILLETVFIQAYIKQSRSTTGAFFGGGFVIASTLAIMSSGLGFAFGLLQLLILMTLAPLGWAWMGLRLSPERADHRVRQGSVQTANLVFPTLLIGLSTAFPMLFLDANELALIISSSQGEIAQWGLKASLAAGLVGFTSAITIFIVLTIQNHARHRSSLAAPDIAGKKSRTWLIYLGAALVWFIGMAIYGFSGQPGFYGEKMLVIFDLQADLSGVDQILDYDQRREWVYAQLVDQANLSQGTLRQTLDGWNIPYQPYYLVNAIEVPGNPLLRFWLERQPAISRVLVSPRLRPLAGAIPVSSGDEPAPQEPEWNLTMIGADRVWADFNATGQGIVIGQSDSGVQWDHPELIDGYRGKTDHNYNWYDPWNHSAAPIDHGGHGTHTLGSILGKNTGVAPGATWIACANLDRNLGNPAYYLDCMQFMLAPFPLDGDAFRDGKPELGAMVLNNSWGCPTMEGCDQEALHPAVQALKEAGIFVVASAGNDGPACGSVRDPIAIYPEVFSVGAVDSSGALANFSSIGPAPEVSKPDIIAPGEGVLSAFPGDSYAVLSGTSMAGPHVAGVVALLWSANPQLIGDIEATKAILRASAKPYTAVLPDCPGAKAKPSTAVGMGILDAYQAVANAEKSP